MLTIEMERQLRLFAAEIRHACFKELCDRGFGHLGGSMSIIDTLAVLYGAIMNYKPDNPSWEHRDWFVLSKGHAGPALYATLALKGFFPESELSTLNQNGTRLPSHCSRKHTPGVDLTTGSLGTGLSAAVGVATGNKLLNRNSYIFCMVGDGELDEGQIWEAVLYSNAKKLDHLILFIDANKKQLDGFTDDICPLGSIEAKFQQFGWHAQTVDGHNITAIYNAVIQAKEHKGNPSVIILNTIKGKGCLMAENTPSNHHVTLDDRNANQQELERLQENIKRIKSEEM